MNGDAFKLQRIQRGVIEICPGRRGYVARCFLPDTAVVAGEDVRAGSIKEKRVRVGVGAAVIPEEGRATVGRFLHRGGAGTARVAPEINLVRIGRIDCDRDVVKALTSAESATARELGRPGRTTV